MILVGISIFITYFLFGDFSQPYFKDPKYHFIKVLQSFWRGSSENQDQDPNMDRNAIDDTNPNSAHTFNYFIKNAQSPYYSVSDSSGYSGYIVVRKTIY